MCNFYLSVAAHIQLFYQVHLWDTVACCWDIKQPVDTSRPLQKQGEKKEAKKTEESK